MNRCPITYQLCSARYSEQGLKLLSRTLTTLHDLPLTAEQLRREAVARAATVSLQGVQPKVAARLNVAAGRFEFVDVGGPYILKPQTAAYPEVPENDDLTMRMAAQAGIDTPFHGLIYGIDGALTYFIRRFDRKGRKERIHVEDFAQLSGNSRATKYRSSMEQVVQTINDFCTFPAVERLKLFRLVLFCFLVGNADMHLKNFALTATAISSPCRRHIICSTPPSSCPELNRSWPCRCTAKERPAPRRPRLLFRRRVPAPSSPGDQQNPGGSTRNPWRLGAADRCQFSLRRRQAALSRSAPCPPGPDLWLTVGKDPVPARRNGAR